MKGFADVPAPQLTQTRFAIVPRWVLRHPDLKPTSKLVYGGIADRSNKDNASWPGQRRLAEDLGLSVPTVNAAVAELEQVGALVVNRRNGRVNRYVVVTEQPSTVKESETGVQEVLTPTVSKSETEVEPVQVEPKKEIAPRARNPIWDAISALVGEPSKSQKSLQGQLVKRIEDEGGDATEVYRRANALAVAWGPEKLTLGSLVKHWGRFGVHLDEELAVPQEPRSNAVADPFDPLKCVHRWAAFDDERVCAMCNVREVLV